MNADKLDRIAKALDISVYELIVDPRNPHEAKIIELMSGMSSEAKDLFVRIGENFVQGAS